MSPVNFPGAKKFNKPEGMTDDECSPLPAMEGVDIVGNHFFLEAWMPSYEDLQALNRGEPFYLKIVSNHLPPVAIFTFDENGETNQL